MEERVELCISTLHGQLDWCDEDCPHHGQSSCCHPVQRFIYLGHRLDGGALDGLGLDWFSKRSSGKTSRKTARVPGFIGLHLGRMPLEYDGRR